MTHLYTIESLYRCNTETEYKELLKLNDFPKGHMWFNQFWIGYVKNTEIRITRRGPPSGEWHRFTNLFLIQQIE